MHAAGATPGGEGGEVVPVGPAGAFRLVLLGELDGPGDVDRERDRQRRGRFQNDRLGRGNVGLARPEQVAYGRAAAACGRGLDSL
jgi:hypothetical protein